MGWRLIPSPFAVIVVFVNLFRDAAGFETLARIANRGIGLPRRQARHAWPYDINCDVKGVHLKVAATKSKPVCARLGSLGAEGVHYVDAGGAGCWED